MKDKLKKLKERFKPSNLSIRVYVVVILIFFCLVAVVGVWVFQTYFFNNIYRQTKIKAIEKTASQLSSAMGNISFDQNLDSTALGEKIADVSFENDACALIANVDNGLVASTEGKEANCPIQNLNSFTIQTIYDLAEQNGGEITLYADGAERLDISNLHQTYYADKDNRQQSVVYAKLTKDANGDSMIILLSTLLRPVNVVENSFNTQLWTITIMIIIAAIIVSLILTKIISKPIASINTQANKLAKGDYSPVFDGNGYKEVAQLSGTLNYAANELSKVDHLKNELIANVSHDLRTPLTMISGYGEIMRDIPGENTPENVQIIIDEANRLSSMVNNLLDLSKLQAGTVTFEMKEHNLTEVIEQIAERYRKLLEKEKFTIKFEPIGNVYLNCDITRINQVIYNLLNNAVNYSTDNKEIEIKESIVGTKVKIEIIDHGIGVKPEELKNIWDRYYRVDKEHTRATVGSGLGLSIVKTILEKHGAQYGVESTYGKGSDFWFALEYTRIDK